MFCGYSKQNLFGKVSRRVWRACQCGAAAIESAIAPKSPPARDILIVTSDSLGALRIGIGMRHWEIARTLASKGLSVTLASTRPIDDHFGSDDFDLVALSGSQVKAARLARRHGTILVHCDVPSIFPGLMMTPRPTIVDLICPYHVENAQSGGAGLWRDRKVIRRALSCGDFFLAGNERQRLYWLGMLDAVGRITGSDHDGDPGLRELIDVVGFGISDTPPVKRRDMLKGVIDGIGAEDFVLIWFGGIWDWLNPLSLVRAVEQAGRVDERIKLFFPMLRKPGQAPTAMALRTKQLCEELGVLGRSVFFKELPVPCEDRADYLLESDLGVVIQPDSLETQLAMRTRASDYIWANLPILINQGDEISEWVGRYGIGICTRTDSPEEIASVLLNYVGDIEGQRNAKRNMDAIKQRLCWSRVVEPIEAFCRRM